MLKEFEFYYKSILSYYNIKIEQQHYDYIKSIIKNDDIVDDCLNVNCENSDYCLMCVNRVDCNGCVKCNKCNKCVGKYEYDNLSNSSIYNEHDNFNPDFDDILRFYMNPKFEKNLMDSNYNINCHNCYDCIMCINCINCNNCQCYIECSNCVYSYSSIYSDNSMITNSENCNYCIRCTNCEDCEWCSSCVDCYDCKYCGNCVGINGKKWDENQH
jgi:hypothetical protein